MCMHLRTMSVCAGENICMLMRMYECMPVSMRYLRGCEYENLSVYVCVRACVFVQSKEISGLRPLDKGFSKLLTRVPVLTLFNSVPV